MMYVMLRNQQISLKISKRQKQMKEIKSKQWL